MDKYNNLGIFEKQGFDKGIKITMQNVDWISQLAVGENNETVENPYTGESVLLEPLEVAVYDFIKGCESLKQWDSMDKALIWFRAKNPKAYMVLLDQALALL